LYLLSCILYLKLNCCYNNLIVLCSIKVLIMHDVSEHGKYCII
jgi:hypothetical protein